MKALSNLNDHVSLLFCMSIQHLFVDPPSPLTSIANAFSSPWPSPHRRSLSQRNVPKTQFPNFRTGVSEDNHRYIQSPHWHLSEARRQSSGYRGLHSLDENRVKFPEDCTPEIRLKHLKDAGYRVVPFENDGRITIFADSGGTVLGCVAPPMETNESIERIGESLRQLQKVSRKVATPPRGTFRIVTHGIQMGHGSKCPSPRSQQKEEKSAAKGFFANRDVQHHLHHVENVFRTHFSKINKYYWSTLSMASTFVYDGTVPSNQVPFASFTLNVGDQCVCGAHIDGSNLPCGLCLASPFGNFDYKKGGHLILHELKLVLEVPPGGFVLFPSAILTHENIPVQEGELRHTITGFTPGTLFQWCDNGFRRVNEVKTNPLRKVRYRVKLNKRPRPESEVWASMVLMFPHISAFF